jgi:cell division protein FtsL
VIRLNLLLLAALVASAFFVVDTAYEGRRLYAALDRAKNELVQLEADHKRLDAERQAQATHLRVERVARERLAMRPATPAVTQYVDDSGSAGVAR